jgi:hypothetical protein
MRVEQFVHAMRQSHLDPGAPICVAVDGSYKHVTGISAPDGDAIMIPTIETGQEVDFRWPDVDGPSMVTESAGHPDDALVHRIWTRKASGQDCTQDESAIILRYFDRYPPDEAPPGSFAANVANLFPLELDQWYRETITRSREHVPDSTPLTGQFDYPRLRKMLDRCVRALNDIVVAQTKDDSFDIPVRLWEEIEKADVLVNSVRDAIPMRTVIRYPAWLDVYVDTTVDDHRISKVTAIAQASDAGNLSGKVSGFAIEHDDPDVADSVLRFTDEATWPDPKLEG